METNPDPSQLSSTSEPPAPGSDEPIPETPPLHGASEPSPVREPPPPPHRGLGERFIHFLFGADTRLGRFMRALLRGVALVVGLFALGVLAAYLLLTRPAQQKADLANTQLTQATQQIGQLQTNLSQLQSTATTIKQQNQQLAAQADDAKAHLQLLRALGDTSLARYSLAKGDAAGAKTALAKTSAEIASLASSAQSADADLIKSMQSRLTLAQSELQNDAQTATSDLGILADQLNQLEKKLFPGQ